MQATSQSEAAIEAFSTSNYSEAFRLYREIADTGNAEAQLFLGFMYRQGLGTNADLEKAEEWFKKAQERSADLALFFLGDIKERQGNFVEACSFYEQAVARGDLPSCHRLAMMHQRANQSFYDTKTAWNWAQTGASRGHIWSRILVGRLMWGGRLPGGKLRGARFVVTSLFDAMRIALKTGWHDDPTGDARLMK